jgi:hypothetical protein
MEDLAPLPSFPTSLGSYQYGDGEPIKTLHELRLMMFEGAVCDKPGWCAKLEQPDVVARWRAELRSTGRGRLALSDDEFEFCMEELRWRARTWCGISKPGGVEGVFASDDLLPLEALLAQQLREAAARMERRQEARGEVDWHPGSDEQVRDLVHPSLYCYRCGGTREVVAPLLREVGAPWGHLTRHIGSGSVRSQSQAAAEATRQGGLEAARRASTRRPVEPPMESKHGLVWLPSEFAISKEGRVTIQSYINNCDPKQFPDLYAAIGSVFERLVPLLEDVLTVSACSDRANWADALAAERERQQAASKRAREVAARAKASADGPEVSAATVAAAATAAREDGGGAELRLPDLNTVGRVSVGHKRACIKLPEGLEVPRYLRQRGGGDSVSHPPYNCPIWIDHQNKLTDGGCHDEEYWYDEDTGEEHLRTAQNPGPAPPRLVTPSTPPATDFVPPQPAPSRLQVRLRGRTLQVITKLSTIRLTPDKPRYNGGAWHVEGMVDESIVATGIYYFDQDNVTESSLAFRAAVSEPNYAQNDTFGVAEVFGFSDEDSLNQPRGLCATLAGRCLAWPNTLQHQVQPFQLRDTGKTGHRSILCFFVVDPNRRIRSSATCPPQQSDWLQRELVNMPNFFRLPREVLNLIMHMVQTPPPPPPVEFPSLTVTESTLARDYVCCVAGIERREFQPSSMGGTECLQDGTTVADLLQQLFPAREDVQNAKSRRGAFSLRRRVTSHFQASLTQSQQKLLTDAVAKVAETLWFDPLRDRLEQPDSRDVRSELERQNLLAALLMKTDADKCRDLLMDERGRKAKDWIGESFERPFSLCEH